MKEPLFKRSEKFNPSKEQTKEILSKISNILMEKLDIKSCNFERNKNGQGINYRIYLNSEKDPSYLLRIIANEGRIYNQKMTPFYNPILTHLD
ncbi:MAG: hypothetical protein GY710_22080 [Desulfobacteraceae bacterium]|nr:hypothetical protein [Desulfobacteraceae bacterium]